MLYTVVYPYIINRAPCDPAVPLFNNVSVMHSSKQPLGPPVPPPQSNENSISKPSTQETLQKKHIPGYFHPYDSATTTSGNVTHRTPPPSPSLPCPAPSGSRRPCEAFIGRPRPSNSEVRPFEIKPSATGDQTAGENHILLFRACVSSLSACFVGVKRNDALPGLSSHGSEGKSCVACPSPNRNDISLRKEETQ